jgi:cytochrome c biogenesis protein CcdA
LWVLAALMVLWMFIALALLMPFQAKINQEMKVREIGEVVGDAVPKPVTSRLSEDELSQAQETAQISSLMITLGIAGSVGMLGLATLSAVFLVIASRRATLRQINASLLEISGQLKQMGTGVTH